MELCGKKKLLLFIRREKQEMKLYEADSNS